MRMSERPPVVSAPTEWDDGGPIPAAHNGRPVDLRIPPAEIDGDVITNRLAYALGIKRGVELAHMRYQEYLLTPEWQATRRAALDRACWACQRCGSDQRLNVHHLDYAKRGAEDDHDLMVLCRRCHDEEHA